MSVYGKENYGEGLNEKRMQKYAQRRKMEEVKAWAESSKEELNVIFIASPLFPSL